MTEGLTAAEVKKYESQFRVFVRDTSGMLTWKKLQAMYKSVGRDYTDEQCKIMIKEFCNSNQEYVAIKEFASILKKKEEDWEAEAFRIIDKDNKGTLTKENLKAVMESLEIKLTDDELNDMIKEGGDMNSFCATLLGTGATGASKGAPPSKKGGPPPSGKPPPAGPPPAGKKKGAPIPGKKKGAPLAGKKGKPLAGKKGAPIPGKKKGKAPPPLAGKKKKKAPPPLPK
eukprot:g798.t1